MSEIKNPLLHILVVGFHHKKGCQVEFSYPSLIPGKESNECPLGWKYLPTLALPDGSHNFEEDTVFFNLPSLDDQNETIFGVSCYRQISVEKLKIRTADVTRSTVQKSVCCLISKPLYGYIEVKLSLIAHAFFDQGDFSSVQLLIDAYNQLNACLLSDSPISSSPLKQIHVGLNLRDLILKWRHKTLLLFKLFLLQKRVICFGSPVRAMCALILGISSIHPLLMEKGFGQVACVRTSRPMSPMPDFSKQTGDYDENSEDVEKHDEKEEVEKEEKLCVEEPDVKTKTKTSMFHKQNSTNSMEIGKRTDKSLPRDASVDTLSSASLLAPLCTLKPTKWNAPIPIFQYGHLCLPYLSLPYMDLLNDSSVLGFVVGTSNILFQQKRNLADVFVDVEGAVMETQDQELRNEMKLPTEDLRFIDFVIRHVANPKEDGEGGEVWIREQFLGYMVALLKTTLIEEATAKDLDPFNASFISAFKKTQCYQEWYEKRPDESIFDSVPGGHPFAGNLSVADMKLRIAQSMQNTESGRKINQAVNTTSKAVGGALSQAKGAFSNWWSSITTTTVLTHSQSIDDESTTIKSSNYETETIENSTKKDKLCDLKNKMNDDNTDKEKGRELNDEKDSNDLDDKRVELAEEAEIINRII